MLTRRQTFQLSARGLAALLAAVPFLKACADGATLEDTGPGGSLDTGDTGAAPAELIDWLTFLERLEVLADQQLDGDWDQETYVEDVASLMLLLDLEDEQAAALFESYEDATLNFPELTTAHDGGHFEVVVIQFDAGDEIPLHNHPDMTGVIVCIEGEVDVEGYDLLDETADGGGALARRVEQATLSPGDYTTLTADRGNIHCLIAPVFTQLLDVFTPPYDAERLQRYRWYTRAADPYEGDDIFEIWED